MLINKTIDVIGVPMDYGANRRGVDMGPSAIRYSGLETQLSNLGLSYRDLGNIPVPLPETHRTAQNPIDYLNEIVAVNKTLFNTVTASLNDGHFPLILGGDHSMAAGSALAAQAHFKPVGVIWIDAHADFHTRATTISGNPHGMPLAAITGQEKDGLADFYNDSTGFVSPKDTVIIGARDLDPSEAIALKQSDVTVFSMTDIDLYGMREIIRKAIKIAGSGTAGIHVSFDLDAVSPKEAPGVGTPVKGGLTYREAHLTMEMIAKSGLMRSLDIVELNPITDLGNVTGELAISMILSALGKNIL